MNDHEREVAAAQALDLKSDPAFQAAVLAYRREQIDALASANPTDADEIRRLQANIKAIDGLCQHLAYAIVRRPREAPPVA